MTEESEARWEPSPAEPPLVASSTELLFLTEDELALYDEDRAAHRRRAPMGFAPPHREHITPVSQT